MAAFTLGSVGTHLHRGKAEMEAEGADYCDFFLRVFSDFAPIPRKLISHYLILI